MPAPRAFDAAVTFNVRLTNSATMLLGSQTLTINGAGLDNRSSISLADNTQANNTLAGMGRL